jgi:NAD(P)-dependent dehydrogenase (short-subunit alcohol dehydrogenase family)
MNIVTGSSGGLGKEVYKAFKDKGLPVLGIDLKKSDFTDIVLDLSNKEVLKSILAQFDSRVDSITFSHAIGNSKKEIEEYELNQYKYINAESNLDFLIHINHLLKKNSSVVFLSSVHSIATNSSSGAYALSKNNLESIYRFICLDNKNYKFNKCMLRIGAMDTPMLHKNVENIGLLESELPSERVISPSELAMLIFDIHLHYKYLLNCSILQIDGGVLYKLGSD